jgi:hypothetical protein
MALLHYLALGSTDPAINLLRDVDYRIRPYREFLVTTLEYLRTEAAVPHALWREVDQEAPARGRPGRHRSHPAPKVGEAPWVALVFPADVAEEVVDAFFDDDLQTVAEASRSDAGVEQGRPSSWARRTFDSDRLIRVLDRDRNGLRLRLERAPDRKRPILLVDPALRNLDRQMDALRRLRDAPHPAHLPLVRLLQASEDAR